MSRKILCVLSVTALLVSLTLLTACGEVSASSVESRTPSSAPSAAQSSGSSSLATQEIQVAAQSVPTATPIPWELYVEEFADETYSHPLEERFDDRHFKLDETPDNAVEALVAEQFYCEIAADFDAYAKLFGENEALQISAHNKKVSFEEGAYLREYVVTGISVLEQDEVALIVPAMYGLAHQDVQKNELTSFALVEADFSMQYSPEALARGPQLGEGRYCRYYLCGITQADPTWKIHEVYWAQ